ncbi:hypothetical protein [Lysobacter gummosus]|uniref:hypothetical protein n=1 Tax=Lysobacter gummosus TaxID=262324 RepID=UPI003636238F
MAARVSLDEIMGSPIGTGIRASARRGRFRRGTRANDGATAPGCAHDGCTLPHAPAALRRGDHTIRRRDAGGSVMPTSEYAFSRINGPIRWVDHAGAVARLDAFVSIAWIAQAKAGAAIRHVRRILRTHTSRVHASRMQREAHASAGETARGPARRPMAESFPPRAPSRAHPRFRSPAIHGGGFPTPRLLASLIESGGGLLITVRRPCRVGTDLHRERSADEDACRPRCSLVRFRSPLKSPEVLSR